MSQFLTGKFLAKSLAVTISALMFSVTASAATSEQQQIQELRKEIEALKALVLQQQQVQKTQAVQIEQVKAKPAATSSSIPTALTSKGGAEVKVYGFVRGDANYIIDGADDDFNNVARTTDANTVKDKLRATAKTTRLGLDFKTKVEGADVGGKVEMDFAGSNDTVRLRHAYLTYNNWLVGQTTSNFLSNHAPFMIDFSTNVGGGTSRVPMVRYGIDFTSDTKLFLAAEEGDSTGGATGTGVTGVSLDGATKYRVPVLTAKLAHSFDEGKGNLSARALVEHYNVDVSRKTTVTNGNGGSTTTTTALGSKNKTGWGLAGGITYQVVDPLKLTADVSYVKGDNKYLYGTNATAAYAVDGDSIEQNEIWAVQTGLTYSILPNLKSTIGYGALFADDDSKYAELNRNNDLANKKVQQAWVNVVYSPVKPLEFGIEYVNGERKNFAGKKYDDDRIGLMAKYSF